MECIPGDKFNIAVDSLLRFAPLASPVMHRMNVFMHYFFVPNRILWPRWEEYVTNRNDLTTPPEFPYVNINDVNYTRLMDYLQIPTPPPGATVEKVSALPFAAYQAIWFEYFRDQNLQETTNPKPYALPDGNNTLFPELLEIKRRCWEHDYFTSALPWAQKGDPVNLPIGDFQDVRVLRDNSATSNIELETNLPPLTVTLDNEPSTNPAIEDDHMYAETSELLANATNVNDVRRAFRLQEWLEKAARAGSRYAENTLAFFGVRPQDSRLQRPEYITGVKSPVVISEVLSTAETTDLAQGNMAGHGVSVTSGNAGNYYCQEHGYIIGVMSVLPRTAYQQGIPKHFLKINSPFELYWPEFANIGEQEIQRRELFAFGGSGDTTFGYTPRYAEYKYAQSRVAGDFRTNLDFWHLGRIFDVAPELNADFVAMDPAAADRIFAVTDPDVQKLYAHVLNKVRAVRAMPKFGTPIF